MTNLPLYGHYTGQPVLAKAPNKNWRHLLELCFTTCMPLLMAANTFELGRG